MLDVEQNQSQHPIDAIDACACGRAKRKVAPELERRPKSAPPTVIGDELQGGI